MLVAVRGAHRGVQGGVSTLTGCVGARGGEVGGVAQRSCAVLMGVWMLVDGRASLQAVPGGVLHAHECVGAGGVRAEGRASWQGVR